MTINNFTDYLTRLYQVVKSKIPNRESLVTRCQSKNISEPMHGWLKYTCITKFSVYDAKYRGKSRSKMGRTTLFVESPYR